MKLEKILVIFYVIFGVYCQMQSEGQQCGNKPEKQLSKRSFGGEKVERNAWPWLVAFIYRPREAFFCGGSLVSSNHVISSAHCFKNKLQDNILDPQCIAALVDKNNLSDVNEPGSTEHSVWEIILHPDWNSEAKKYDADISVVVLRDPVKFSRNVYPICLPQPSDFEVVGTGTVVGWGKSEESEAMGKGFDSTPNELQVPAVNRSYCLSTVNKLLNVASSRAFCAGFINESKSACTGDNGNEFYLRNQSTGNYELIGVVSASLDNFVRGCDIEVYSFYANVAKFVGWILNKMEETKKIQWKNEFDCDIDEEDERYTLCSMYNRGTLTQNRIMEADFSEHKKKIKAAGVEMLKIDFMNSTYFFVGIGQAFPNLKRLRIDAQSLKTVERENFEGLEKIEVLDLSHNKIGCVLEDIFWDLPNLEILAFSDNQIKGLPEKLFHNLEKIKEINFSNNKIESLPENLFANNLELERIFAYKNPLKIIDVDFITLTKLKTLWLEKSNCIDVWVYNRRDIKETQKIIKKMC